MQRSLNGVPNRDEAAGELDLRALGLVLNRRRRVILIPTLIALAAVTVFVNVVTPRYTSEAQVLLENQETFFTRPDRTASPEQASLVDPEAVGSQIQLVTSRDLARRAIKELGLAGDPEFDPAARGLSALSRVLILIGLKADPMQKSPDMRMLQTFQDKLTVFSPPKTRVISIQFQSSDPELAARAANKMADLYITEQSAAKRVTAKEAADALGSQIADLRIKVAKSDAERERYRAENGLLAGGNNMTISGQQLADINSDLSKARSAQAEAQAKASMLRDLIHAGKTADVTEVVNNDLVRRVSEQRVTAQAQLALESRTLLPGHPRIKELAAQVADLDLALKGAAKQAVSTLENEAKIAGHRVANLEVVLTQQKKIAGAANGDEVRLRSLDRIAQSYKDQLDSSTTKYQEAMAREESKATPADARVISRAAPPQEATFPKKLPFIAFGTLATFIFAVGFVAAGELLSGPGVATIAVVPSSAAARRVKAQADRPAGQPSTTVDDDALSSGEAEAHGLRHASIAGLREALVFKAPDDAAQGRSYFGFKPMAPAGASGSIWRGFVAKMKAFSRSAAAARAALDRGEPEPFATVPASSEGQVPPAPQAVTSENGFSPVAFDRDRDDADDVIDVDALAVRIVAAHIPGRGLHIVGASLGASPSATDELLDLGRALAERGRTIIVDLNATPAKLARLAGAADGSRPVDTLAGLAELLSGSASFAEVIHRDHASRLHFIPTGLSEADFRDFDLILDALSETYDFILLLAPAFPKSEIAKVMAPYADFVVLTTARDPDPKMLGFLEAELIEAGAREILVIGQSNTALAARKPHVA